MFNEFEMVSRAKEKMKDQVDWLENTTKLEGINPTSSPSLLMRIRGKIKTLITSRRSRPDQIILQPKYKDKAA